MYNGSQCEFERLLSGRCEKTAGPRFDVCPKHRSRTCSVEGCDERPIEACDETMGNVTQHYCAQPLCESHDHEDH